MVISSYGYLISETIPNNMTPPPPSLSWSLCQYCQHCPCITDSPYVMLLLVFSPPPPSLISTSNIIQFFYGKETITFTWPSFVLCNVWTIIETTLEIWSCTDFNLDRKTSIKVGDLRWSELQINFTDRGRNIWYNEEIN